MFLLAVAFFVFAYPERSHAEVSFLLPVGVGITLRGLVVWRLSTRGAYGTVRPLQPRLGFATFGLPRRAASLLTFRYTKTDLNITHPAPHTHTYMLIPPKLRGDADRAKSEACRVLREKEALRERVAALQSATDRAGEVAETAERVRDEARLAAAAAAQRMQQEGERLAETEGENEGLRTRLQMAEEELAGLVDDANQVR